MKFTVDAKELDWALRNTKPYAGTDTTTPILRTIRVRAGDNVLIDATDRYAVGQARIARKDEDFTEQGEFLIPIEDLATILPSLKSIHGVVTVDVGDERISIGGVSFEPFNGDYPGVDKLWPDRPAEEGEAFGITALTAKKLAAYKPVDRLDKDDAWKIFPGEAGRPMVMLRNKNFRVLGMGTRIPDRSTTEDEYASW